MATESLIGLVIFGLLLAAFTFYAGNHREKDYKPSRKIGDNRKMVPEPRNRTDD